MKLSQIIAIRRSIANRDEMIAAEAAAEARHQARKSARRGAIARARSRKAA